MSKLNIVLVILGLVYCIHASPVAANDVGFGNDFPNLDIPTFKPLTDDDIKNMKPADKDSVVSGISISSSSSAETVDGVPVKKKSSGHVVRNDNGKVTEVNF